MTTHQDIDRLAAEPPSKENQRALSDIAHTMLTNAFNAAAAEATFLAAVEEAKTLSHAAEKHLAEAKVCLAKAEASNAEEIRCERCHAPRVVSVLLLRSFAAYLCLSCQRTFDLAQSTIDRLNDVNRRTFRLHAAIQAPSGELDGELVEELMHHLIEAEDKARQYAVAWLAEKPTAKPEPVATSLPGPGEG